MKFRSVRSSLQMLCGAVVLIIASAQTLAQTQGASVRASPEQVQAHMAKRKDGRSLKRDPSDPQHSKEMADFVAWMQATHKAPFHGPSAALDRRKAVEAAARQLADPGTAEMRNYIGGTPEQFGNIKVNQDLNPYPKTVEGVAINPANGNNFVVAGYNSFYATTTHGRAWLDDYTPTLPANHFADQFTDLTVQPNAETVGISIDRTGTSYSALNIQEFSVIDPDANEYDVLSEVAVATAHNDGLTPNNQPTVIASEDCDTAERCDAAVETKGIVTNHSGTASDGSTYIYYTLFCNSDPYIGCPNGLDFGDSVIAVQTIAGTKNFQFLSYYADNVGDASVVIDGNGQPHIIEISYTNEPSLSILLDDNSTVLTTFEQPASGLPVIQCDAQGHTAYCVFQTTQAGSGVRQTTNNIYLVTLNLTTAATTISRVNNDPLGSGKEHNDPHVAVTPSGDVYVGWYDNRQDPTGGNFNFFVGKSTDGGKTFPIQRPVNDVPFDPFVRLSSSIAAGPDGVVHAVWTDTRDHVSPQIWSQAVRF